MRIAGVTLPDNKRIEYALTALYGVGIARAQSVLKSLNIEAGKRPTELTADEEARIRSVIEKFTIEGDLRRDIGANIKRLKDIASRRGDRHARGMKVRGQTSKTNSRTVPSGIKAVHRARKTMTSGRTKVEKT